MRESTGLLRIGELSRRSGVSPELLRAWERRYGLLEPTRSAGGLRLYSAADLERVRAMQQHLAEGLAAAEAAALAAEAEPRADQAVVFSPAAAKRDLDAALSGFEEARAHVVLDELLATATLDSILSEVLIPFLHELGERWERGEITVAQEHFASSVLRGRLLGLARGWDRGIGPRVLLSCAPGERHDLGLIAFGLALRARGFRILLSRRRHADRERRPDSARCAPSASSSSARSAPSFSRRSPAHSVSSPRSTPCISAARAPPQSEGNSRR